MNKAQKKIKGLVDLAAAHFSTVDNVSTSRCFSALVAICAQEEKDHRGWGPDFAKYHPHAPSVQQAARFFAVHRIGEYLAGKAAPEVRDYLHLQRSAFHAAAVVANYETYLRTRMEAAGISAESLAALDYCTYVSPEEVAA